MAGRRRRTEICYWQAFPPVVLSSLSLLSFLVRERDAPAGLRLFCYLQPLQFIRALRHCFFSALQRLKPPHLPLPRLLCSTTPSSHTFEHFQFRPAGAGVSSCAPSGQCSHTSGVMDMSKKIVVKLDLHDGRDKQRAIKAVSALVGVDSISVDMASQKMTVIGMVDPVTVVSKLRKASCSAAIFSVGPAKEPEKKEEKKEEKKDGDAAKKEGEGEKKDGDKEKKEGDGEKKDGEGKEKKDGDGEKKDGDGEKKAAAPPTEQQIIAELMNQYRAYHPYYMTPHYYVQSMEENPNSCVIC